VSLLDMLGEQLGGDALHQIGRQVGAHPEATSKAVSAALPMLISAMAKNTAHEKGAGSLLGALDRDHDGSILDDVAGFLGGGETSAGAGILGHVLGGRQAGVEQAIGKSSGLDAGQVGQILAMLAPVVMGALSRQRQQKGLDASGLAGLLTSERQRIETHHPHNSGILGQLLDSDGDGEIGDDLGKLGMGLLGSLFGGKGR